VTSWLPRIKRSGARRPSCNSPEGNIAEVHSRVRNNFVFKPIALGSVTVCHHRPAALAQSNGAERPEVSGRSYQLLREDEDWSFLRDRKS